MQIPLKSTDLDGRALIFDCWTSTSDATQMVYVRLYGAKGRRLASWVNRTPAFQGSASWVVRLNLGRSGEGFVWEPKEVVADGTLIEAVEIVIGTSQPDRALDIYVDNLRMTKAQHFPFDRISTPKKLWRETPLVEAGRASAVIIAPDSPEYLELAQQIRKRGQGVDERGAAGLEGLGGFALADGCSDDDSSGQCEQQPRDDSALRVALYASGRCLSGG